LLSDGFEIPLSDWPKNCYNLPVRRVAVIVFASMMCVGLAGCSSCKREDAQPAQAEQAAEPKGFVRIEGFNLDRETNDGSRLELNAQTALFFAGADRAELEEVDLVYRLASGSVVSAHANKGVVNTSTGSSEASGNVVVHTDYGFWFLTNILTYDSDSRKMHAPGGYMAFGPELVVRGKDLSVDLEAESFSSGGPVLAQIWDFSALEKRVEQ